MYYFAQVCRACIQNDGNLIKIDDEDFDNITFYKKITVCFPNMIFDNISMKTYLCQNCSNILRKMYDFRELCINSDRILNTYIFQLNEANSFNNSESCNLKELMDDNYKDLKMIGEKMPELSEVKLETVEFHKEFIKTEPLDFECNNDEWIESNSLLKIKNEPLDIEPDGQDCVVSAEGTAEKVNYADANKDTSVPPPNTAETSRTTLQNQYRIIKSIEKGHNCNICSKTFDCLSKLRRHHPLHTGEKLYECDVCLKRFSQSGNLNKHKKIHTDQLYRCDVCNICFNQSNDLRKHNLLHTGEKRFDCEICHKSFNRLDFLNRHTRIHTGEKPFKCDLCEKSFIQAVTLDVHKRIHTGEKPYKCDECSKHFSRLDVLQIHMRIHTGEKPYECDLCLKRFNKSGNLQKHKEFHLRQKHVSTLS